MEKRHPIPANFFVDPKVPKGTSDSVELQLLRELRARVEKLWIYADGAVGSVVFLERALYPVDSKVANVKLTAETKESSQSAVPGALDLLSRIEREVLTLNQEIATTRQKLSRRVTFRLHNLALRGMGLEEIKDDLDAADEDDGTDDL